MSKILKLMDNALQQKTQFQENFFARHFTNIIALISVSSFLSEQISKYPYA